MAEWEEVRLERAGGFDELAVRGAGSERLMRQKTKLPGDIAIRESKHIASGADKAGLWVSVEYASPYTTVGVSFQGKGPDRWV